MTYSDKEYTVLKYGKHSINLPATFPHPYNILKRTFPEAIVKTEEYINSVLDSPINAKPFNSIFKKDNKVVIIISDITRFTSSEIYLPIIIDRLNQKGIDDKNITIICALGIHRKQTVEEHKKIVGSHIYKRIKIIDHDGLDKNNLTLLGKTKRGTAFEVNSLVNEADQIILTGSIRFHYFAGFGGGRKSILPGVASFDTCVSNHLLALNPKDQGGRHPLARTGILKGNPVHEDMSEACNYLRSLFLFNTILSPQKELLKAVAGDVHTAFNHGCRFLSENFSIPVNQKAELLIVSCGGDPYDINFIQAHKAMDMAVNVLKEGGVMILLAESSQGFGNPRFLEWFNCNDPECFEKALRNNYEINGQTAYATFLKARKYHIILISDLNTEEVKRVSLFPSTTIEEALESAYSLLGPEPLTYIIPDGSSILTYVV